VAALSPEVGQLVPAGQLVQTVAPASAKVPAVHAPVAVERPEVAQKDPAVQLVQLEAPVDEK